MQSKPCRTMKKNKTKQNTDTVEEKELHCYVMSLGKKQNRVLHSEIKIKNLFSILVEL